MSHVATYYEDAAKQEFAQSAATASAEVTGQPDFTATYYVSGEGGGTYGLRIVGGKLEVVPGGIPGSDMEIFLDVREWLQSKDFGMANPFYYYLTRKVGLIKTFRGTVGLELSHDTGAPLQGRIVFGGAKEPSAMLRMKANDYLAMMNGKLNSQMAFLTGKLKFDGSLPLLLQLATINS